MVFEYLRRCKTELFFSLITPIYTWTRTKVISRSLRTKPIALFTSIVKMCKQLTRKNGLKYSVGLAVYYRIRLSVTECAWWLSVTVRFGSFHFTIKFFLPFAIMRFIRRIVTGRETLWELTNSYLARIVTLRVPPIANPVRVCVTFNDALSPD